MKRERKGNEEKRVVQQTGEMVHEGEDGVGAKEVNKMVIK
jgi:hypothetical protein